MIDHLEGAHRSIWHLQTSGEYEKEPFDRVELPPLSTVWDNPALTPTLDEMPQPARNPLLLEYRRTTP